MKKIVLRSLAASTLALSGAAVAQDMDKKVTVGGNIQMNLNTSNSADPDTPNFNADKSRLKVKVAGGIASAEVEVELNGNKLKKENATAGSLASSKEETNTVSIRRANLNLDVLTLKSGSNTFTTTLSMGGIRIGGADLTAADVTWAPQGYSRQDGAYLKETLALGKMADVELGLGIFNNVNTFIADSGAVWNPDATNQVKQSNWFSSSWNKSMGIAAHVAATVNVDDNQSIGAKFYYGSQNKAPSNISVAAATTGAPIMSAARDVSHMEASVIYNHAGIFGNKGVLSTNGAGFWYEIDDAKGSMTATAPGTSESDFTYGSAGTDTKKSTLMGFGVAGDTGSYLTGMLQKGDRLTYAVSYATLKMTDGATAGNSYNDNQMAFSVGYAVSTFEIAFNLENVKSDKKVFADNGKTANPKDTMMRSYLTMAYQF